MELNIGSNIFINNNGILNIDNEEQCILEIGENDGKILLSMNIYDKSKVLVGKLRRNSWVYNDKNQFEINTNPQSLKLINKLTAETIIEINVETSEKINILSGKLYSKNGRLLLIKPDSLTIGGLSFSGNVIENCGGSAIKIQ